jgi:hypothetical protein
MTKLQKTFASTVASGALLLNAAMPLLATTTIEISGNGAMTVNGVEVNQTTTTQVNQDNTAIVNNTVNTDANTGGNNTSFNTGGDVAVATGNAVTGVSIDNNLNSNTAVVECCEVGSTDVNISGNGAFTTNYAVVDQKTVVKVDQDNKAVVKNNVNSELTTGKNKAGMNTGGDVTVMTGHAISDVSISTMANNNVALVGGGWNMGQPSVSLWIADNGAFSKNMAELSLTKKAYLDQDNWAYVKNTVNTNANTGYNKAKFNTGGDVAIMTGNAASYVDIDNMVNFNHAAIDCGCTWDVFAKIAGNGAKSTNWATLMLASKQKYDQDNLAKLNNVVNSNLKTGKNYAGMNTGDALADPWIYTGNAVSGTSVSNSGNVNTIGGPFVLPLPWWGTNLDFSFSISALLAYFGLSMSS